MTVHCEETSDGWVQLTPPVLPDDPLLPFYLGYCTLRSRSSYSYWNPEEAAQRRIEWLCQPGEEA